jgi:DMSO/TMAO reductase YedYZ molybdopterin-dependent catalytic subunit
MTPRWLSGLLGVVATLFGVGVAHLVASLLEPDSSPVQALGAWVVDLGTEGFMAPVKDWAIEQFGEDDKLFLQAGVVVGMLVLAVVAGLLTRLRFEAGAAMMIAMIAAPVAVLVTRPVFGPVDLVPSLVAAAMGVAALWWLHRSSLGLPLDPRARSTAEIAKDDSGAPAAVPGRRRAVLTERPVTDEDEVVISPGGAHAADEPSTARPSRRGVLVVAGVLTAAAAVLGGTGRWIVGYRGRAENIDLPDPVAGERAPALPRDLSQQYDGITPLQVDDANFYRVDTRLDVPVVDSEGWTLTVDGDVEEEFTITFDELLEMDMVERDITLTCVSNSVGGEYVGGARWLGVPLQQIIDRAKPGSGVDQMLATDFDGMTIGTPYDLLTDGREALLCVGMNGEPLSRERGFPVRVVIPGLYGFISATKWVTRLTFTTYAEQESYWTERKWDTRAPIKPSARIDTPKSFGEATASGDKVLVGGVAWAQNDGGVSKVQIKVDGGPWEDAQAGPEVSAVYWRQWYAELDLDSGRHSVAARVVDGNGEPQSDARANPFPGGSSGIHSIVFNVA